MGIAEIATGELGVQVTAAGASYFTTSLVLPAAVLRISVAMQPQQDAVAAHAQGFASASATDQHAVPSQTQPRESLNDLLHDTPDTPTWLSGEGHAVDMWHSEGCAHEQHLLQFASPLLPPHASLTSLPSSPTAALSCLATAGNSFQSSFTSDQLADSQAALPSTPPSSYRKRYNSSFGVSAHQPTLVPASRHQTFDVSSLFTSESDLAPVAADKENIEDRRLYITPSRILARRSFSVSLLLYS